MGDVDERDPELALKSSQHPLHPHDQVGVEGAHRLVEEQDLGLGHEGASECDALALAAREVGHLALRKFRDIEPLQPLEHLRPPELNEKTKLATIGANTNANTTAT